VYRFAWLLGFTLLSEAGAATLEERGDYLVNAVMACDLCHTPRNQSGLNIERRFSGGAQTWDTPTYKVRGSNITPEGTGDEGRSG